MERQMTWATEPDDVERLLVVGMMHLGDFAAAVDAWLAGQFAALQVDIGVGTASVFQLFRTGALMFCAPLALIGCVTGEAIRMVRAALADSAAGAKSFHANCLA
jgi:hypothetical protein